MDWTFVAAIAGVMLIVFLLSGLPVAVAFIGVSMILLWFFLGGERALVVAGTSLLSSLTSFTLVPIALFILMGEVLYHSGLIGIVIDAVDHWMGHFRARLCLVGIGAGTILAAMTGVAMGSLAVLGSTLLPEMTKRGYERKLSMGSVMAGSSIAAIIPPSMLAVVVGSLAEISVAAILMAGVIPGLLLAFLYICYVIGVTRVHPEFAPVYPSETVPMSVKLKSILKLAPFTLIIFAVLGVIILGIATPTEASALGAFMCYVLALAYRRLTFKVINESLLGTIRVSGMVLLILMGGTLFSQVLATTGVTRGLSALIVALPLSPLMMVIVMQLMIFVLCMFMDQIALMMVTLPIFMPIVWAMNINPLMFGTIFLINIVVGGKTPPFGYLIFVMKGVYPVASLGEIYRAFIPWVLIDIFVMGLILAFPQIAIWFPSVVLN